MTRKALPGLFLVMALFFVGCDTYAPPAATIRGIVHPTSTVPNYDPLYGVVVLDTDSSADLSDPATYTKAYYFTVTQAEMSDGMGNAQGVPFVFEDVAAGSYYVYAMINMGGVSNAYVIDGNGTCQWGYFGDDYQHTIMTPTKANVVVGSEGWLDCDFWINTWVS